MWIFSDIGTHILEGTNLLSIPNRRHSGSYSSDGVKKLFQRPFQNEGNREAKIVQRLSIGELVRLVDISPSKELPGIGLKFEEK